MKISATGSPQRINDKNNNGNNGNNNNEDDKDDNNGNDIDRSCIRWQRWLAEQKSRGRSRAENA